jgi:hypothetical protein
MHNTLLQYSNGENSDVNAACNIKFEKLRTSILSYSYQKNRKEGKPKSLDFIYWIGVHRKKSFWQLV